MLDFAVILRSVDFIEASLRGPVTISDMADSVTYSLYHFCRRFNQATHHSPYDYLMRRRLSCAARQLVETNDKVLDIALDFQFRSHETFSRAFKRMFGLQPLQFRKRGFIDPWKLRPRLTRQHLELLDQGVLRRPELIDTAPLQLVGIMTMVEASGERPTGLWASLRRELATRPGISQPSCFYSVTHYPDDWASTGFHYLAAVPSREPAPDCGPWVTKAIPALRCARFVHMGSASELPFTLDYAFSTWSPKSGMRLGQPWVIECFPDKLPDFQGYPAQHTVDIPIGG